MNRREFIRHIGIGIAAGAAVPFIPSLLPENDFPFLEAAKILNKKNAEAYLRWKEIEILYPPTNPDLGINIPTLEGADLMIIPIPNAAGDRRRNATRDYSLG